jgi:hypothetical protein
MMIMTVIRAYGQQLNLACDGNCNKAYGINNRPKNQLSNDEDNYEWLADHEIGIAPIDPKTYVGDHAKPTDGKHNKWCFHECERSASAEFPDIPQLPDFSNRHANIS